MGSDPSLGARPRATAIVAVAIASAVIRQLLEEAFFQRAARGVGVDPDRFESSW
jgi:hypothetical protein